MKNIGEVRKELSEVFYRLKTGQMGTKEASEMNNAAGKIINSCKVQLDYLHLSKREINIPFLES